MSGARGSGRGPRGGGPSGARGGRPAAAPTTIRGPAAGAPAATSIRGPPTSSASASANRPTPPITSGPSSSRSTPIATTSSATTNFSGATTGIIGHKDKSGRIVDLISPDDRCPNCKTDRYLNPRLKLLVSPCYHKLCTSCIDRIWALGPAPCPACGHVCRKSQFGSQTFSDLEVEREVDVRKRVGRLFAARRAEDFESLKEYNDWLEEAEQLTFNLVNRIDVEETNAKLAQYERSIAAAKNANNDDITAATEALDARLQQLRQARIARRRAQDLEDATLRREEEKAVVAALEEGQEEEELAVIQAEWHEKRLEVERRREEQEAEDVRVEEEVRREIAEAQSGVRKAKARGGVGGGEETRRPEWKAESLLQFAPGPMATLSVGDELLEPAISKVCAPVELRTASTASSASSWTPYDPWIEPFLDHLDDAKRTIFKAGGYDVAEWWRYQMRTGVGSLGVEAGGRAASS